jgi:hypothetical protein
MKAGVKKGSVESKNKKTLRLIERDGMLKSQFECCKAVECCSKWDFNKSVCIQNDPCLLEQNPDWQKLLVEGCSNEDNLYLKNINLAVHSCDNVNLDYCVLPSRLDSSSFCFFGILCITNSGSSPINALSVLVSLKGDEDPSSILDLSLATDDILQVQESKSYTFQGCVPIDDISQFTDLFLESVSSSPDLRESVTSKCCLEKVENTCNDENISVVDCGITFDLNEQPSQQVECQNAQNGVPINFSKTIDSLDLVSEECFKKVYNKAKLVHGTCEENGMVDQDDCNVITYSVSRADIGVRTPVFCAKVDPIEELEFCPKTSLLPQIDCVDDAPLTKNISNANLKNNQDCHECGFATSCLDCVSYGYRTQYDIDFLSRKVYFLWKLCWDSDCPFIPCYDKDYTVLATLQKQSGNGWIDVANDEVTRSSSEFRNQTLVYKNVFHLQDLNILPGDILRVSFVVTSQSGDYTPCTNSFVASQTDCEVEDITVPVEFPQKNLLGSTTFVNSENSDCSIVIDGQFIVSPGNSFDAEIVNMAINPSGFEFASTVSPQDDCCGKIWFDVTTTYQTTCGNKVIENYQNTSSADIMCKCPTLKPKECDNLQKGVGSRWRSFSNTGGDELYVGVGDLGQSGNRNSAGFTYQSGTYPITFSYDPNTDQLSSTIVLLNNQPIQVNYQNVIQNLANRNLPSLDLLDVLEILVFSQAANDQSATVILSDIFLKAGGTSYSVDDITVTASPDRQSQILKFY